MQSLPPRSNGIISQSLFFIFLQGPVTLDYGPHPTPHDLILANYTCKDPFSKCHILRYLGLRLQHTFLGGGGHNSNQIRKGKQMTVQERMLCL